jgi:hypothetical protein
MNGQELLDKIVEVVLKYHPARKAKKRKVGKQTVRPTKSK